MMTAGTHKHILSKIMLSADITTKNTYAQLIVGYCKLNSRLTAEVTQSNSLSVSECRFLFAAPIHSI